MAISKVTLNGTTLMDATIATATDEEIISGYTALTADGVMTTGTASSGADLSSLEIYVADFIADPPTVTSGAFDGWHRTIVA